MIFNPTISGGGSGKSDILVYAPTGSTVTVQRVAETPKTAVEKDGVWTFKNCNLGTWTVNASLNGQTATDTVVIQEDGQLMRYEVIINYRTIPEFTYTGTCKIIDDNEQEISNPQSYNGDFNIQFLTSGDFTITGNLISQTIDVFVLGGGGGSGGYNRNAQNAWAAGPGGAGYHSTVEDISVEVGTVYPIVIGAGGNKGSNNSAVKGGDGGTSSAFGASAPGGTGGNAAPSTAQAAGGESCYAFDGMSGTLYAQEQSRTVDNSGNGAVADYVDGSSGIVIIRNARGAV